MTEWETEEEILRSMGNRQYENYVIVSRDEADRRINELKTQLAHAQAALHTIVAVAGCKGEEHRMFEWIAQRADKALAGQGGEDE